MNRQHEYKKYVERKERRLAAGMCGNCGLHPPASGFMNCKSCVRSKRLSQRKSRLRVGAKLRGHHEKDPVTGEDEWISVEEMKMRVGQERCVCGLTLPCLSCLPTIYEVASGRHTE